MTKDSQTNKKKSFEYGINGVTSISDLEVDIMKIIWKKGNTTVREVHEELLMKRDAGKKQRVYSLYNRNVYIVRID